MTSTEQPKVYGAGLIALDWVFSSNPGTPVRSWAGGTCGNVLSILAYLGWRAFPIARLNGDPASTHIRADMERWNVRLDYASCTPTANTPIIVQQIRRSADGRPKHRFSWSCPHCGQYLPAFKPVTIEAVEYVIPALKGASVFFLDRLSRATLTLAAHASTEGAVVIFEPSAKGPKHLFAKALELAHVVKYSDERLIGLGDVGQEGSATRLEIRTLGERGLKYRHRFDRAWSDWFHLDAITAPRLSDPCGSGDWCTAGFIAKVAARGQRGFRAVGARGITNALRYGQALAAWNCGFEGARGGMYAVERHVFERQIGSLLSGQLESFPDPIVDLRAESLLACPACPPPSLERQYPHSSRARRTKSAA